MRVNKIRNIKLFFIFVLLSTSIIYFNTLDNQQHKVQYSDFQFLDNVDKQSKSSNPIDDSMDYFGPSSSIELDALTSNIQYSHKWGSYGSTDGLFDSAGAIAVNSTGYVYIGDIYNYRVQVFDSFGNYVNSWGSLGTGDGQFNHATGIAINSTGFVFVSEYTNNRIQIFDSQGNFVKKFGSSGSADGQFNKPEGLRFNSTDYLFITDSGNDRIQVFDSNGNFVHKWGVYGSGTGQLNNPVNVAFDSKGNVFVTEWFNNRVQVFDTSGNHIQMWGSSGSSDGQFNRPYGIAIDNYDNVFVVDIYNNRIQAFKTDGTFITKFGISGSGDGQFNTPTEISIGSTLTPNTIFVTDQLNHRVQALTYDVTPIVDIISPSATTYNDIDSVTIAYTISEGTVNVFLDEVINSTIANSGFIWNGLSLGTHNITIVSIDQYGKIGKDTVEFTIIDTIAPIININSPISGTYNIDSVNIEYTVSEGSPAIYLDGVANTTNLDSGFAWNNLVLGDHNLTIISSDLYGNIGKQTVLFTIKDEMKFQFSHKWGSYGATDGLFDSAGAIAVNSTGYVYIGDIYNYRVQVFDSFGNYVNSWGSFGTGDGQFNHATGIAINSTGFVFISEYTNNRIQIFDSQGNFIKKFGSSGSADGQFNKPEGLRFNSTDYLFITDSGNDRIQVFDSNGNFVHKWGVYGSGTGQLNNPVNVAFDSIGNVFVTEWFNNRVQVFDTKGNYIRMWGTSGSSDGQFNRPYGIAIDNYDNVFVVDMYNNRIQAFKTDGTFITKFGISGSGDGQFNTPTEISIGSTLTPNTIFVTEQLNHRVQALYYSNAPIIDIISPTATTYNDINSISVSYTVSDGIVSIYLDGVANSTTANSVFSWSGLNLGEHNITITSVDPFGNVGKRTIIFVIAETQPPSIEITSPSAITYNDINSVSITYTVSDGNVTIYLDNIANITSINSGYTWNNLGLGDHNLTIISVDQSGNIGKQTVIFTIKDTIAPIIDILNPTSITYNDISSVSITYTVTDGDVTIYLDDIANTTNIISGYFWNNLGFGDHNITIISIDQSGNISKQTVIFSIIDTEAPIISITSPTSSTYNNINSATIIYSVSDGIVTFFLDGIANTTNIDSGYLWSNLGLGDHNITIISIDPSGNLGESTVIFSIIDTDAPIISITSPTSSTFNNINSATIIYGVSDGIVTIFLDSIANTTNIDSGYLWSNLGLGNHNITIVSIDQSGNIGKQIVVFTIADTNAPVINITSPTNNTFDDINSVIITYTVSDGHVAIYLDDLANSTNIITGYLWNNLGLGGHNITIISVDQSGNIGKQIVLFAIVDTQSPIIVITSPITDTLYGIDIVTITYTVSEGTITVYLDDILIFVNSGDDLIGLADGLHNITIVSIDLTGNIGKSTSLFSVDTTPPDVNITSPASDIYNTGNVLLTYTVSDGSITVYLDDVIIAVSSGNDITGLLDGLHNITIISEDSVGNIGKSIVIFTVDTSIPNVTSPLDITYRVGETGNIISWIGNDIEPSEYTITRDSVIIQTGIWISGVEISINIDGLIAGTYTFVLSLSDTSGNLATDTVFVIVENIPFTTEDPTATTIPRTTPTSNSKEDNSSNSEESFFPSFIIIFTSIFISVFYKKKKM